MSFFIVLVVTARKRHVAIYKISALTTKIFLPAYSLYSEIKFNDALRDIFAHMTTSVNRLRKLKLEIYYENLDVVLNKSERREPIIFCTTHIRGLPYALMQLLDQLGYRSYLVSAGEQRLGWNWGSSGHSVILNSNDNLFIKLRRALKRSSAAVLLVDFNWSTATKSGLVSPNVFSFAAKNGYSVVFFAAVLQGDGSIKITFGEELKDTKDGRKIAEDFVRWMHSITHWNYEVKRPRGNDC